MSNGMDHHFEEDFFELVPVNRLKRDTAQAALTLSEHEVRFLVDAYYQMQENRIRSDSQIRSMTKDVEVPEPHAVLQYLRDQNATLEKQLKRALDGYSANHPVGEWLRAQVGIGPVIAAGLLAHIDIDKAPTVGHIWRFAGLDPTLTWNSSEYTKGFVKSSRDGFPSDDWSALLHICKESNRRPLNVLLAAKVIEEIPEPQQIRDYLSTRWSDKVIKAEFHADNMLREALDDATLPHAYADLMGPIKFDWNAITQVLTKRPFNAALKSLCWKLGESFVKNSNREGCYYGQLYKKKKEREIALNEQGANAEASALILKKKNFNKSTDAYKSYIQGRLPPAHIHARARRYAVKLFLAHLHEEMYRKLLGKEPPLPYPIAYLGHAHYIGPAPVAQN